MSCLFWRENPSARWLSDFLVRGVFIVLLLLKGLVCFAFARVVLDWSLHATYMFAHQFLILVDLASSLTAVKIIGKLYSRRSELPRATVFVFFSSLYQRAKVGNRCAKNIALFTVDDFQMKNCHLKKTIETFSFIEVK